jgi:hypothetical protein
MPVINRYSHTPPYLLIQYPRFTATRKKKGKLKKYTVHQFKNTRQSENGPKHVEIHQPKRV